MMSALYYTNMLTCIFIVLALYNNSPWVDMSLHSHTISLLQISLWLDPTERGSNPQSTVLKQFKLYPPLQRDTLKPARKSRYLDCHSYKTGSCINCFFFIGLQCQIKLQIMCCLLVKWSSQQVLVCSFVQYKYIFDSINL